MHIDERPASWRSTVNAEQASLFVMLARELIQTYTKCSNISLSQWFELPEYNRFLVGAYACGFVCRDFAPMSNFEDYNSWPRKYLSDCPFKTLRHWLHSLIRSERWAFPYSSPIQEAIRNEILQIVLDRLERDDSLRKPMIVICDESQLS